MMIVRSCLIFCLFVFNPLSYSQADFNLFDDTVLHEIRLTFSQENFWDTLTVNYQTWVSNQTADDIYTEADIEIDGVLFPSVGARLKGLSSYYYVQGQKKSFKIDFNEFIEGQAIGELNKLNLFNGAGDPSMLRDFLSYDIMRTAGVKVPRMSFAKLFINEEYRGVYGIIEQIDDKFVKDNFPGSGGTLIKNNGFSELLWEGEDPLVYQEDFQLKTNEEEEDWSDFIHFLDVVNNTQDIDFAAELESIFDVNLYLHAMAVDVLLDNWDSYLFNQRNWYLYNEPLSEKIQWLPWDYNLCLGGHVSDNGNPYPPVDDECDLITDFTYYSTEEGIVFSPRSNQPLTAWFWDFGESTSETENPVYEFLTPGSYRVCFYGQTLNSEGELCEQRRCKEIDTSFSPLSCNTIANGSSPYPATDPVFQQVVATDNYCCSETWDAICDLQYFQIYTQQDTVFDTGSQYTHRLPVLVDDEDKVLAYRILEVPEFREKYLNILCVQLADNFTTDRLFSIIDDKKNLLSEAIFEDPNYIYTPDYFEYSYGDGSGGGEEADIPALKFVIEERIQRINEELSDLGHACEQAFTDLNWQDIVINELAADNSVGSGITDSEGEFDDWIELYNNTNTEVDLSDFYLSDEEDLFKWQFPMGTIIEAESYLIVWADRDEQDEGLHTNFKLSKAGESLTLSHEDGTLLDQVSFTNQLTNLSSSRVPNGVGDFVQQEFTFNISNEALSPVGSPRIKEDSTVRVFPNPSDSYINIESRSLDSPILLVKLLDAGNRIVRKDFTPESTRKRVSLEGLPKGIYFLQVHFQDKSEVIKINFF